LGHHIRGHGCRNLLVYCESVWCNHSAVMNADWLPDEIGAEVLAIGGNGGERFGCGREQPSINVGLTGSPFSFHLAVLS
jgi:hypothetical protein